MNIEIKEVSDQDKERVSEKVAAVNEALEELRNILEEGRKCEKEKSECGVSKKEPLTTIVIGFKNGGAAKVYRTEQGIFLGCLDKDDDDETRCILTEEEANSLSSLLRNAVHCYQIIQ